MWRRGPCPNSAVDALAVAHSTCCRRGISLTASITWWSHQSSTTNNSHFSWAKIHKWSHHILQLLWLSQSWKLLTFRSLLKGREGYNPLTVYVPTREGRAPRETPQTTKYFITPLNRELLLRGLEIATLSAHVPSRIKNLWSILIIWRWLMPSNVIRKDRKREREKSYYDKREQRKWASMFKHSRYNLSVHTKRTSWTVHDSKVTGSSLSV